ncbi:stalk domain-containing protein [Peptoniphilus senegalensis]|uniref:Stalk domain-containing protein n=2 Tax=Peptoniphilus senegalensis TaxID=1465757 RepID=A0ABV1J359_9FIRM
MKKVVATTMATLLFGLSIPVNSFALPNNTEGLESNIIEDFNVKKFNGRIIDRDPNFRLAGENNRQQSADNKRQPDAIINSKSVGGVKPEGYVTVTYKVDPSMGKFKIGGDDVPESRLEYFVNPKVDIQLFDVSSVKPAVKDTTKYELDEKNPWIIEPSSLDMQSEVKGDITLTANIRDITTGNPTPGPSIAERIKSNNLRPVDISVWLNDEINWKEGVELDTSVNDEELKKAFDEATFDGGNRNSKNVATTKLNGTIKVTFKDTSSIEVQNQRLFVFPHITASSYGNAPKDAVETTFLLGEGTKAGEGQHEKVGSAEQPVSYQTYKIKPGTDVLKATIATNVNIFNNISAKTVDDSYSDLKWEPENYIVNENNNTFTARAIKSYKVKFEFKAYDTDNGNSDINSLPKELKDKLPSEVKVKKGESYDPTKPANFVETVTDNSGEVTNIYEWTFSGWNPTRIGKAEKDETITGTWKRKKVTSAKPTAEKATEGDKVIKGQGIAGSTIKIKLGDNKTVESKVLDNKKWEATLDRELKKDEKVIITQVEKGKKESEQEELTVAEKENNKPAASIADRIKSDKLHPVDISVWENDEINWKNGVKLDDSVSDPELKKAFEEANFKGDNRDSVSPSTSGSVGNIVVTFKDNSSITVNTQKLFVFPHVTSSTFTNTPKDAVVTTFLLGEGTKAREGQNETVGNAEHPVPYKTYKIKSGTDVSKFNLPTKKNIFDNISAMPADDSYSDLKWEPENYIVSENNKTFTARAIKSFKISFEFKAYDSDNGNNDINSLPKDLTDKLPKELKVKKGDAFDAPTKPENFVEILKDNSGEVTKVYEWTFSSWNPTRINNAEKDEKMTGTWKRKQVTSAEPTAEKATEGDKAIKGQGIAGSTIKIKVDNKIVEANVTNNGKWEAKLDRELKKGEKVIITQVEKGKKESEQVELTIAEKEDNKPTPKPEPNPQPNPNPTPNPKPEQKPIPDYRLQALKRNNYDRTRTYNVNTYISNRTLAEDKKDLQTTKKDLSVKYVININNTEYEFVKDGVTQKRRLDVMPTIKNDRLMLPLRSLAEMIGSKVEWNSQTRVATFTNNDLVAKIQIDGDEILLSNGKVIKMDSKPLNINGRILVSISNVANVFGLTNGNTKDGIDQDIEWDEVNKTVTINLKK